MKKFKEMFFQMLPILLSVVILVSGFCLMASGFLRAYSQHEDEYTDHLTNVAEWLDERLDMMMSQWRTEMRYDLMDNVVEELDFLTTGRKDGLLRRLQYFRLLERPYVQCCLVVREEKVLLSSDGSTPVYTFPMGIDASAPFMSVDAQGKAWLSFAACSPHTDLIYVVQVDWNMFYHQVVGKGLNNDYRLYLYNEHNGLYLGNMANHVTIRQTSHESVLKSEYALKRLAEAEESDERMLQTMREEKDENGAQVVRMMVILPTSINCNGVFTMGVMTEITYLSQLLFRFYLRLLSCSILVLIGCSILIVLINFNRRRNVELKEKTELLRVQNEEMQTLVDKTQELFHHQALETIGVMTSGIAHEFSNLLTPIMGYSIMTMEMLPMDSDELLDNLNEIYTASQRAKSLISRICALSRKENSQSQKQMSPDALMVEAWEMVKSSKPSTVHVIEQYSCPEKCLLVNETQLIQLLLNIILNAFAAMEGKEGILELSTLAEGEHALFRLRDNGVGIASDALPHIFEPFYTTKCVGRGTGLGLAIAWQIAEAHGGTIQAESVVGEGTTFTVVLPMNQPVE